MRILTLILALAVASPLWAVELGDDGLHKTAWMRNTFKDMAEDLGEANAEGKRMLIMFEQRGCIYCTQMHEEVFPDPVITKYIEDNYFVVQMNLFGDEEVTDFDGTVLTEKKMASRWGVVFTPTLLFMPEKIPTDKTAAQVAVMMMPGAFHKGTTLDLLNFVVEKGYAGDEHFQKYHARKIKQRATQN